jgi:glutamine amidotransferase
VAPTGWIVDIVDNAEGLTTADAIILPGVGAFGDCMANLMARDGMVEALNQRVHQEAIPFLGICVGMQLLASTGLEHGTHAGLGWLDGQVVALTPDDPALKIPHMGWNNLHFKHPHALLEGLEQGDHAYFVHSYHMVPEDESAVLATTDYGQEVVAMVGRNNWAGVQFHPEKSQKLGLKLLANFMEWRV